MNSYRQKPDDKDQQPADNKLDKIRAHLEANESPLVAIPYALFSDVFGLLFRILRYLVCAAILPLTVLWVRGNKVRGLDGRPPKWMQQYDDLSVIVSSVLWLGLTLHGVLELLFWLSTP